MQQQPFLEPEQKALEINLDDRIYGTFAEIGAGQEVARYFFQAGAALGTIAKTMSAYDKTYSDEIYGPEPSGRYVCESRLYKMLEHEYDLMQSRLQNIKPNTNFFVFADTVAAINYTKTIPGDGWLGIRFQLDPNGATNDLVIHVKMLDNDNRLQQQAIGILGTNLIYSCYRYQNYPEKMLTSLMDSLQGRVLIDMVRLTGPNFINIDNRLLSLMLVKNNMTNVAMFGPNRQNIHASEFLYKKSVLVVRGSFRPITLVNEDMINTSYDQFKEEHKISQEDARLLLEITIDSLKNSNGDIDEKDFLDRVELLNSMGYKVVVSNCEQHLKLIKYLNDYKVKQVGLALGVIPFTDLVNKRYLEFRDKNDISLLSVFGELFPKIFTLYVYPAKDGNKESINTSSNMEIPEEAEFIFQYLKNTHQIVNIDKFNANILNIFSHNVFKMIQGGESGWENMVPKNTIEIIKSKHLFELPKQKMEFEY